MDLSYINFLAVIVATLAAFALGAVWYSVLFKNAWIREVGLSEEEMKKGANMGVIFGTTLFLTFIMALGLAMIWHTEDLAEVTALVGLYHGLAIGLAFVATSTGINYIYQRKSMKLWAIDAGYQVTFLALIGAILGAWH